MVKKVEQMKEGTNGGGFLVSIVCTARDVIARSNQFGGTVLDGMFKEEVRHEIEAASFKVWSIVNGWSSRNQQFNGVCGMTKGQRNKSVTAGNNG